MSQPEPTIEDYRAAIGSLQVDSPKMTRLKRFKKRYGGEIYNAGDAAGLRLYGATVGGERVTIGIEDGDGEAFTWTIKDGRKPLSEPEPLQVINPAQWHGEPIPDRQWYIPDLVPMRQVTLLYGDGGVGKSLLALQIAAAGSLSVETLGLEPWAGRVLYLGAEDEADEFHRRLADIVKAHSCGLDDLHLFRLLPMADADAMLSLPDKAGIMQPTPLWMDLAEYAEEYRPKLIVLDTVADLFGGDEVKRGQARQFVAMLRKLAIHIDCAIILLAHPSVQGMTSGTGTSGSTGWSNSARSRLYMTRDKDDNDLRLLKTMKVNYAGTGGELKLRWHEGAFILDDGKPSAAAGILQNNADKVFLSLLSQINRSGRRVSSSKSVSYAPTVMADMPEAASISKKALAEAMARLFAAGKIKVIHEGPPSKKRERLVVIEDEIRDGRMTADQTSDHVPTDFQPGSNGCSFQPPITPGRLEHPTPVGMDRVGIPSACNDNEPLGEAA